MHKIVLILLFLLLAVTGAEAGNSQTANSPESVQPEVILYSASWCGICRRARNYFYSQNIAFTEYDVETTVKGAQDFKRYRARGVPLIFVNGRRMDGFSVARFRQLYRPVH